MNIEFITDADYDLPHETKVQREIKTPQASNPAVGPAFKCGSMTLVKTCAHKGCACQSIKIPKYKSR